MHVQCPHCNNPVEIVEAQAAQEILCPSCGSSFRLDQNPNSTVAWTPKDGPNKLGRFELIDAVGVGAFGTVYKAHDPELDRTVAIKVPRAGNLPGSSGDLDRFVREARSVARLRHPSIVPVHEVGQQDGVPYLVSDFVQGITLADLLSARRPAPSEAANLIADLADALQYAHEHGVVHRDVKPSNIMLENAERGTRNEERPKENGTHGANAGQALSLRTPRSELRALTPRLMDFGLAKRDAGEITMTLDGQVLGTPAYMSPEQARGEGHKVDGRSDVYSLGVILYQMLTGELPFRGTTRMLLHQVLHDEPRPPRSLNDRIPRDMETICLKAMAKEPDQRFLAASGLADDLRRFLKHEPIKARPVGQAEKVWRWCRRNPIVAGLLSAVLLLLASLTVGSLVALVLVSAARNDARNAEVKALDALGREEIAHDDERRERVRAQDLSEENSRRLTRQYVANGLKASEEGDHFEAALWFGETLKLTAGKPEEKLQRIRLATALAQGPRLLQVFPHDQAVLQAWFSPDGRRVFTITSFISSFRTFSKKGPEARIWDLATGKCLTPPLTLGTLVQQVSFSSDGTRVLTRAGEWATNSAGEAVFYGELCVWDAYTGKPITPVLKEGGGITNADFSPDGRLIAAACQDNTVRLLNATTGKAVVPPLQHEAQILERLFSPDSKYLLILTRNSKNNTRKLHLWDVPTGRSLCTATPARELNSLQAGCSFSPDGRHLFFVDSEKRITRCDTANAKMQSISAPFASPPRQMVLSPDGSQLALVCGESFVNRPRQVHVLKTADATLIMPPIQTESQVSRLSFSPDGRRLLVAWLKLTGIPGVTDVGAYSPGTFQLWDTVSGKPVFNPVLLKTEIAGVQFNGDGRSILTVSRSDPFRAGSEARVWNAQTGQPLTPPLRNSRGIGEARFSRDGRLVIIAGTDGMVQIWDSLGGQFPQIHPPRPITGEAPSFSPDGLHFLTRGRNIVGIWNASTGAFLTSVQHPDVSPAYNVDASFSKDGKRLLTSFKGYPEHKEMNVSTRREHTVKRRHGDALVWEVSTGKAITPSLKHDSLLIHAEFSPDGERVLTAWQDGTIRIWNVATGALLVPPIRHDRIVHATFSPDGAKVLTAGTDNTARIWDATTGQALTSPLVCDSTLRSASFSPNGQRILTLTEANRARVWDTSSGQPLTPVLDGGMAASQYFSKDMQRFSPDSSRLLVMHNGHVQIITTDTGQPVTELIDDEGDVFGARWSHHGTRVLTFAANRVRVWDASTGTALTPVMRPPSGVMTASFSSDGLFILAHRNLGISLWDATTGLPLVHLPRIGARVHEVALSPDGRRLLAGSAFLGLNPTLFDLTPDTRPAGDLLALATLLSNRKSDSLGGLIPSTIAETTELLEAQRSKYPKLFAVPSEATLRDWHAREATAAEQSNNWFVANFHLEFLIEAQPEDMALRLRLARVASAQARWDTVATEHKRVVELADKAADKRAAAELLNNACWEVVSKRNGPADAYKLALPLAEATVRLEPENGNFLNSLGVAMYRIGQYQPALDSLKRADKLNSVSFKSSLPADLAFWAMAEHQFGQKELAKTTLGRLREVMKTPQWANNAEAKGFLKEAVELIERKRD